MEKFELSGQLDQARILIAELKDMGAGEDSQLVADMLEGELDLQKAIEAVVSSVVMEDGVLIDGIDKIQADLKARQRAIENRIERKRTLILTAMQIASLPKVVTPVGTVSLKQLPPKLIVTDESVVPPHYFERPDPVLSKKSLMAAVKEWNERREEVLKLKDDDARQAALIDLEQQRIPGAELSNGGQTIQIRT